MGKKPGVALLMICDEASREQADKYNISLQSLTKTKTITMSNQFGQLQCLNAANEKSCQAFLIVVVPKGEPFGVADFVANTDAGSPSARITFSHPMVRHTAPKTKTPARQKGMMLSRTDKEATDFYSKMVEDYLKK
jgi:hypothetical protein